MPPGRAAEAVATHAAAVAAAAHDGAEGPAAEGGRGGATRPHLLRLAVRQSGGRAAVLGARHVRRVEGPRLLRVRGATAQRLQPRTSAPANPPCDSPRVRAPRRDSPPATPSTWACSASAGSARTRRAPPRAPRTAAASTAFANVRPLPPGLSSRPVWRRARRDARCGPLLRQASWAGTVLTATSKGRCRPFSPAARCARAGSVRRRSARTPDGPMCASLPTRPVWNSDGGGRPRARQLPRRAELPPRLRARAGQNGAAARGGARRAAPAALRQLRRRLERGHPRAARVWRRHRRQRVRVADEPRADPGVRAARRRQDDARLCQLVPAPAQPERAAAHGHAPGARHDD